MNSNKGRHRFLALLLSFCMVLATIPATAFAAEGTVAYIDDAGYDSLSAAVEAASSGDVITLQSDDSTSQKITIDEDLTIELNGHDLTATAFNITNGNVVIRDRSGSATIRSTVATAFSASFNRRVYGTVYVTGGNLILEGVQAYGYTGSDSNLPKAISIGGGSVTVNSGTFTGGNSGFSGGDAVYLDTGSLTIKSGTFMGGASGGCGLSTTNQPDGNLIIGSGRFVGGKNDAAFWLGGNVTTVEKVKEYFLREDLGNYIAADGASFNYKDITVGSGLFLSPSYTEPENGSSDEYNPAILIPSEDDVVLEPHVLGGEGGELTYTWYKDGLDETNKVTGENGSTLTVEPEDQNGNYYVVVTEEGTGNEITLYWEFTTAHYHPVCGDSACGAHGENVAYSPLDAGSGQMIRLSAGNYYLTEDLTLDNTLTVSGDVNLCLNGHTLNFEFDVTNKTTDSEVIGIKFTGGTLNICDCSDDETGKIRALEQEYTYIDRITGMVFTETTEPHAIYHSGDTVNLYSGSIEGDDYGIYTDGGTKVNVYGGEINGWFAIYEDTAAHITVSDGALSGGVWVEGKFTMTGGTAESIFAYGLSTSISGGTVNGNLSCVNENGIFMISGDAIINGQIKSDNKAAEIHVSGGTLSYTGGAVFYITNSSTRLYLSGNPTITGTSSDIILPASSSAEDAVVIAHAKGDNTEKYIGDALSIRATSGSAGDGKYVAQGVSDDATIERFSYYSDIYELEYDGANNALRLKAVTYDVMLQEGAGYTLTPEEGSSSPVAAGGSFSFKLKIEDGYYKTDEFAVKANGTTLTADSDGIYAVNDIHAATAVTVEGVVQDETAPTVSIKMKNNTWREFLNNITFGLFFKDTQEVAIEAADTASGVAEVEYFISDTSYDTAEALETVAEDKWISYKDPFNLEPNHKYIIYAKATDNVGNVAYVSSQGIVIYTDAAQETEEISFTKLSGQDVSATVTLNDNTVEKINNGTMELRAGTDYTVAGGTITFKAEYLDTLAAGEYTMNVSYNPLGEKYVDDGDNDAPVTTSLKLTVSNAQLIDVSVKQAEALTYSSEPQVAEVETSATATGGNTVTFTYSDTQNGVYGENVPAFTEAGEHTVYFKAFAPSHDDVYGSFIVTIDKAEITVTIDGKSSVYGDDIADLTAVTDGILGDDTNVYKLETAASKTSNVGKYDITGVTLNDNYDIDFENGTDAYEILPRELTVELKIKDKQYDGLDRAEFDGTPILKGLIDGDVVNLTNGTPSFTSVTAGKDIAVKFTDFSISREDSGNYKLIQPVGITASITNDWIPSADTEYIVSSFNENGWMNVDFVITAKEGYELSLTDTADGHWSSELIGAVEGGNSSITLYVRDTDSGAISLVKTEHYKLDKNTEATDTAGKVYFDERNGWEEFLNTITFGLLFKNEVTVKVEAQDALSGIDTVEYAVSDEALTLKEVKEISDWRVMPQSGVPVTVEDTKQFVYYVRITDKAGNVTYLSTDGAEYDITSPTIDGIENGGVYYTSQKVTVTDRNLESVTLNGALVTLDEEGSLILSGNIGMEYAIAATDKAGNSTVFTVTMKPIAEVGAPIDDITEDNVKSTDRDVIEDVIDHVEELLQKDNLTEDEKEALEEIKDKAEALLEKIADVATEIEEVTDGVKGYDPEAVTSDDKSDIEELIDRIDSLLEGDNLTEDERADLEEVKDSTEVLLEKIADVAAEIEEVTDGVNDYDPETVTSGDKSDIEDLIDRIDSLLEGDNLTEDERADLEEIKDKAEDLLEKIADVTTEIEEATDGVNDYDPETVTSEDKTDIEELIDRIDSLLEGDNLTEDEREDLTETKEVAQNLLDKIEEIATAVDTENTEKVKDITAENVTPDDKSDLENAKENYEKALEDYANNLTEEEKAALQDEIDRIDEALEVIENVKAAEDQIGSLPDIVSKKDADAIKAAEEAYNSLTDYEKSLVDRDVKTKLDKAVTDLAALDKIDGADVPATGYAGDLWMWFALLFVSGGVMGTLVVYDRKRITAPR